MKEACVQTQTQISKTTTISFSFSKEKISLRNCVLNPDSRREKEKENVLSVCPSLPLRVSETLLKINRVVVV